MKKAVSVILKTLAVILALILALVLALLIIPLAEIDSSPAVSGSADWMGRLDDGAFLGDIIIPGTHDTGTAVCELSFITKCQYNGVAKQLEDGYRYLDIRLMDEDGAMRLMHGFTSCKTSVLGGNLTLDDVLNDCYAFLKAHPTETVIFAVKQEYGDTPVAQFQRDLDSCIKRSPEMWLLTDTVPTLGEARGKLVLLRRYNDEAGLGADAGIEFNWPNQGGSEGTKAEEKLNKNGFTLAVQDRYEYDTEDKWSAFSAAQGSDADVLVDFLSTKGSFVQGHPYFFASALNKRLDGAALRGWVIVDFGTAELAKTIYSENF